MILMKLNIVSKTEMKKKTSFLSDPTMLSSDDAADAEGIDFKQKKIRREKNCHHNMANNSHPNEYVTHHSSSFHLIF